MSLDPAALQLARLEREVRFHARLRELLLIFSQGVTSSLSLTGALESVTHEVAALLGARRVDVWLHDRRQRELHLAASTDVQQELGQRVPTSHATHVAVAGLRLERARFERSQIVAPLRGFRRALGAVVIDAPRKTDIDRGQLLDFAHEIGRQLSAGIENVQLLDEILRQRRLLEDTFNSLVDLVAVMDREFRVVQTNDAFAARLGATRESLLERPVAELVGPETAALVLAADPPQAPLPAGTIPVQDDRLGGAFLVTVTPLVNRRSETVGRVLVARDITVQTRLEAEREALRERLGQSEKLASLGQFVAGIAHEMNNPLQGVLGHLELLMEMTPAARPLRRQLRQIYQDADRAAKIVRNLLVFAGSRRMTRRRVQVDRVLAKALASRGPSLRRNEIALVRGPNSSLPPVLGDPLLLQQAMLNILINAEHAILEPGIETKTIEISTGVADGLVSITVRDSGIGIPTDVLPRIFDPFFTTKDVGKGTGLGLAITYGIIQEHGGTISATNDPRGGAVFRIDLPPAEEMVK